MTRRDELIEIIEAWAKTPLPQGSHYEKLADAIIAAGPIVSDEVMAKLRQWRHTNAHLRSTLDYYAGAPQREQSRGFDRALEISGLLSAVKEQE